MFLIRTFQRKAKELYRQGLIQGPCHLYEGQEALAVSLHNQSQPHDTVITSYRNHAHALLCGVPPRSLFAEMLGREGGICKGKGGSMHIFYPHGNFYGGHGIVGAQVSLGTGLAFALKYKGADGISFIYMGEGAVNQGQVSESFNMASLWSLPAIYIIEDSKIAKGTRVEKSTANSHFLLRAKAYSIKGERVDGMNLQEVINSAQRATSYVRNKKMPYVLHVDIVRLCSHFMGVSLSQSEKRK